MESTTYLLIPRQGRGFFVFFVMQLYGLAGASHERIGYLLVFDRELKFIGLDGNSGLSPESTLDKLAFVSLPDVAFVNHIVELAGLDSFAKHKIVSEKEDARKDQQHKEDDGGYYPAFSGLAWGRGWGVLVFQKQRFLVYFFTKSLSAKGSLENLSL